MGSCHGVVYGKGWEGRENVGKSVNMTRGMYQPGKGCHRGRGWILSLSDPLGCDCPDWIHRGDDLGDSGCKHIRRVRLAVGIDPIPVELLDEVDHCLQNNREKFGAEPGTISIEDMDAQTVETMTDGGREKALKANSLACGLVDIDKAGGDFDVFCALCELVQDGILRKWDREETRQKRRRIERERREHDQMNASREILWH